MEVIYIRNGPNPQFIPSGPHHLFDGDGMLHSIRISKGKPTFCTRFVKTYKYNVEREFGSPVVINYFSAFTSLPASVARYAVAFGRVISGQYDVRRGTGNANTSLAHFGGKLFAICESDLPYTIKLKSDEDIITLGRDESFGEPLMAMTAHPKVDKETGEAFAFRPAFPAIPNVFQNQPPTGSSNRNGNQPQGDLYQKIKEQERDTATMLEQEILKGKQLALVNAAKVPRLGIIPRNAEDDSGNLLHVVNAWEEDGGDTVVVVAPNLLPVEDVLERMDSVHSSMERIEINLKAKTVARRPVSARSLDFAVTDPAYVGKKTKYIYAAEGSSVSSTGLVKVDLSLSTGNSNDCVVASRLYGPGCYGDSFICDFVDPPLRPSIDPKLVLSGNYAPVEELPPTVCEVEEGSLPSCLDGAYIRNGPNPQFIPPGPHHLFDGDGMLHSIRISQGKATFCSRFVKTYKYNVEREFGTPVGFNYFSAFTSLPASVARYAVAFGRVLSGQYDVRRGTGNANTSLAHFGGKLFALCESDLPYAIKLTSDGDIITLGRDESFGEPLMAMTAHPKVDKETGEAFAFRPSISRPFLTYFRINPDGIKQPEVPIFSIPEASLVHDFALTRNYAIFPDTQMVINPKEILKGKPPVLVNAAKVPRLGIIPRNAEDESGMMWIEVPGLNLLHAANAWEEDAGDTVVMVAPNLLPVENVLERMDSVHSSMERIEINLKAKTVARRPVSARSLDFAVINPAYVGKKTSRYIRAAAASAVSHFHKEPDNPAAEEDDGYLVTYIHNEITEESKFLVMDAKSPSLEIVASVKLPAKGAYGFHGLFVRKMTSTNSYDHKNVYFDFLILLRT
ncbi:putative carotenoid cleavage dioxygenase 4, chloroplastic [Sesamum alatum]|uniref:Carotenoid cleavage dioxygenase 4, chloroplastic n=1 Tax=Sesamum alatum TaxID=300844 RepID=A0AAE2CHM3_9LAMI|nr:putative carotenoid cleavage dioxygenase 4, chloroplastic [Sesamum alatum]